MIRRNENIHKSNELKNRFLVFTFIILLIESIAWGEPKPSKKDLSCKTLRAMARIYMAYGEYTKAQPLAEQALTLAKNKGESDSELSMCLIDLATLYKSQDKLLEAENMC